MAIIFIAYALQTKYQPFLPPNNDMLDDKVALTSGMALVYVRSQAVRVPTFHASC